MLSLFSQEKYFLDSWLQKIHSYLVFISFASNVFHGGELGRFCSVEGRGKGHNDRYIFGGFYAVRGGGRVESVYTKLFFSVVVGV